MTILVTLENPDGTGAPRMALQYARALVAAGHRVVAACGPPSAGTSSILPALEGAGVRVRRVPPFRPRNAVRVMVLLRALVREEDVRLVVGFQQRDRVLACMVAGFARIRCAISAQSRHVFRGGELERRVKKGIYALSLRRQADLVICPSRVVEEEVRSWFGVDGARTCVLPNGIDVRAFPTFEEEEVRGVRRELGVTDEDRLLLNVGRIDRQKGQDLLLRAFRSVAVRDPRVRLAVVGAVGRSSASDAALRYQDRLHSMVEADSLADRVLFLGWRDDVPRLLAAADLYVQPSRWEGWPLALVEAMAASLPVVASDCTGRPEGFVDGEHGWIVPTGDVPALRKALDRALSMSDEERRRLGRRGRALAERDYDVHRLGERFVELVEGVLRR